MGVDGRPSWTPARWPFVGDRAAHVVQGARGYLAHVATIGEPGSLWLSADGREWEQVWTSDSSGEVWIHSLDAGDDGFVALGSRGAGDDRETFAIASADGRTWSEATSPPGEATSVVASGGNWIASGKAGLDPVDVNAPSESPVWFSANGLGWEQIGTIPLKPIVEGCLDWISRLHHVGRWLVSMSSAAGLCSEGRVVTYGTQHISSDGFTWEALPFKAVDGSGGLGSAVFGTAESEDALVMVGQSNRRAAFWFREP